MKTVTFDETKWKLVPLEATQDITEAICHAKNLTRRGLDAVMSNNELESIYRAMIAAAPEHKEE
jgi:hypothetical protein